MSEDQGRGHLPGTFRTVALTRHLRKNGIARFHVGRSASEFTVVRPTLLARLLRKGPACVERILGHRIEGLPEAALPDSIRLSLMRAFQSNPDASRLEVDTCRMSWCVVA